MIRYLRNAVIYFIQAGEDGPIKIGYTRSAPRKRLKELQTAAPQKLRLLGTTDGGRLEERALHRAWGDERLQGEWFNPVPSLLALVAEVAESDPDLVVARVIRRDRFGQFACRAAAGV